MKYRLPPVSGPAEGHAERAPQVRPLVHLVANRVAWPAFPVAARIAVLDDEVADDAMDTRARRRTLCAPARRTLRTVSGASSIASSISIVPLSVSR